MQRSRFEVVLAFVASTVTGALSAQEHDAAAKPASNPSAAAGGFARVQAAETRVRCFAGDRSPHFEERLVEGQFVQVGDVAHGHREVRLPQGMTGWVHKKFVTAPEQGMVTTNGTNVAFRYRPQSGEAPVTMLKKDALLFCLGEQGEWWRVRSPDVTGYLPEAELQVFATPNPTIEAGWRDLEQNRQQAWKEATAAIAQKSEAAAALQRQTTKLGELQQALRAETAKPIATQDLAPIEQALAALIAELPADSAERTRATELQAQLARQNVLVTAAKTVTEPPKEDAKAKDLVPPRVEDPLGRFDATGWLRHRSSAAGIERFRLEKGGQLLCYLDCSSGRYDLSLFQGCEVGITGSRDRPHAQGVRVIDVQKLEVIGLDR
jgi:SH3-like domain-containing protein